MVREPEYTGAMTRAFDFRHKRNFYNRLARLRKFVRSPWAGGVVLILFTVLALVLANLPWTASAYHHLLEARLRIGFDGFSLDEPLEAWVNDGLMAVFFFYVGLEIKREVIAGRLSGLRQAALPLAAALGGMVFPALIYFAINPSGPYAVGWGVPTATDIAFALGVLSLFGPRVPVSLKVFLTALAIVDDLGAIVLIAVFYSTGIDYGLLAAAGGVFALLLVLNRLNVYRMCLYLSPSILLWVLFLHSGVHATIAGVLIAMTIPATPRYSKRYFGYKSRHCMDDFRRHDREGAEVLSNRAQMEDLERLSRVALQSISPSQRLEHGLHHTVAFFIMPVFALANAGVTVDGLGDLRVLASGQGLGIFLGLVLGKPLGIFLLSRLCVRLGWGALPEGATWRGLLAVSCLGGIGFTMSIFINTLAFGDPVYVASGKIAVLAASFSAIGVSLLGMRFLMRGKASETE